MLGFSRGFGPKTKKKEKDKQQNIPNSFDVTIASCCGVWANLDSFRRCCSKLLLLVYSLLPTYIHTWEPGAV
jgi:hypothetical protein